MDLGVSLNRGLLSLLAAIGREQDAWPEHRLQVPLCSRLKDERLTMSGNNGPRQAKRQPG